MLATLGQLQKLAVQPKQATIPGGQPFTQAPSSAPAPSAPASSGQGSGGPMTYQQANDPAYVRTQVIQALTQKNGGQAPSEADIQQGVNYVLTPDTYSDNSVRSGWSPYWADRLGNPAASGGSGADMGGASTLVPGGSSALPNGGGGGAAAAGAGGMGGNLNSPLLAPYSTPFQPTGVNSILQSPAFQAAEQEGTNNIQRSAAANGTLVSGGTLKDLQNFSSSLGLGAINDQYNRDLNTAGFNRDTFYANQNNPYNKELGFAQLGLQGANSLGNFGSQYASGTQTNANQQGNLLTGQGDANAGATQAQANNNTNTIGNIANGFGQVDWSKIFRTPTGPTPANLQIPGR